MSTDNAVAPGDVIAGKYRVDRVLGKGGMGMVVAATHLELLEPRAIKLMLSHVAENAEHAARFLREARIAARLKSEYAAKVFDMGRTESGVPYMVMEYLEGEDLAAFVRRAGPLSPYDCAVYMLQACDALAEAHAVGLVHRDIKHQNLFLTRDSTGHAHIKVLDFGISRTNAVDDQVTVTGEVLGTPLYMSPEQMQAARDLDARADIWSLGVLMYWLLTVKYPFPAKEAVALIAMVTGNYPVMPMSTHRPDIPSGLDAIVMYCLQRERNMRPSSVAELARMLLPFAPGSEALVQRIERRLGERASAGIEMAPNSNPPISVPPLGMTQVPMTSPMMVAPTMAERTDKVWQTATGAIVAQPKQNPAWVLPAIIAVVVTIFGVGILIAQRIISAPVDSIATEVPTQSPVVAAPAPLPDTSAGLSEQAPPAVVNGVVETPQNEGAAAPATAPAPIPKSTKKTTKIDRHSF